MNRMTVLVCALATLLIAPLSQAFGQDRARTGSSTIPKVSTEPARGQERRPHIGVLGGVSAPENSYGNVFEYGVDVGFQPYVPFSLALELSGFASDRVLGEERQELVRTQLLAKGAFNFGGNTPIFRDSYIGLGLGPVFDDNSPWTGTHFGIAPVAGFDVPLRQAMSDYLSLGVAAKYVFVSGPAPDGFSMNGIVKYWF